MTSAIEIFESMDGVVSLELRTEGEAVWASQADIEQLFGIDQSGVSRHIRNILRSDEVDSESNMQKVHIAGVARPVTFYSLDVVLAVGYRANSARAVEFRRWSTDVLKRYMLKGVATNERRLLELDSLVKVLSRSTDQLVAGVAEVVARYLPSLRALRDYDEGEIPVVDGDVPTWTLTYDEARAVIDEVGAEFPVDALFGGERGDALRGVVATIYQGFGGVDLYPTVQEKAANLLYLVVKDHPLTDGNKRSAAALFVHFLARNQVLDDARGVARISNNALAAITLMVAMSDPKEKELMIALLVSMLAGEG
ncbi:MULTISPECIES: virulence protein RhuM/Fic/DOC family protein [Microbacterium]|uniref:Virulence protein RhuM/Fic/DOC family protein n=1 Tax=Microbacterium schleiferi TaxID=69362 RepID=A0A7S8MW98_9MICO|nr:MULTISPECIES: virulence protein RhuM/Fic/DOC family protein [Microbacterium]QPE03640.1 virulence protein RhuM/Fic/DOC family protein [Microbacterium schleiferi]|tara:strand:+ start:161 stop:1090 length:930 start_codon:yes stop_codon:yes gene_type:complete